VVATAVEGLPDVLAHGRGILVSPDDPEALAHAIADVLAGRRRPDIGAARRYAATFTPHLVARECARSYRRLMAACPRADPHAVAARAAA
jgi:glycosyltransferase involved in cell wall biosynthesis